MYQYPERISGHSLREGSGSGRTAGGGSASQEGGISLAGSNNFCRKLRPGKLFKLPAQRTPHIPFRPGVSESPESPKSWEYFGIWQYKKKFKENPGGMEVGASGMWNMLKSIRDFRSVNLLSAIQPGRTQNAEKKRKVSKWSRKPFWR